MWRRFATLSSIHLRGDLRQVVGPVFVAAFLCLTLICPPLVLFEFGRAGDLRFEGVLSTLWLASLVLPILLDRREIITPEAWHVLLSRERSGWLLALSRWASLAIASFLFLAPLLVTALVLLPAIEERGESAATWRAIDLVGVWALHTILATAISVAVSNAKSGPALYAAIVVFSYLQPALGHEGLWSLMPDFAKLSPLTEGSDSSGLNGGLITSRVLLWCLLAISVRSASLRPRRAE